MIAPVKDNPSVRRRSPLAAARQAVADALLAPRPVRSFRRRALTWAWLLAGLALVIVSAVCLALHW